MPASFHLQNVDILDIKKEQFTNLPISGGKINFFNELFLNSGEVSLQENGYLVKGGNFIYNKMQITPQGHNKILIEKNPLRDLSEYKENFIQHTNNGLKIQSKYGPIGINLNFLEGNEIFKFTNEGLKDNEERVLNIKVLEGDGIELINQRGNFYRDRLFITPSKIGTTIIENGRHIFKFESGQLTTDIGDLNTKKSIFSKISS